MYFSSETLRGNTKLRILTEKRELTSLEQHEVERALDAAYPAARHVVTRNWTVFQFSPMPLEKRKQRERELNSNGGRLKFQLNDEGDVIIQERLLRSESEVPLRK